LDLKDRINEAKTAAMKDRNKVRLAALRLIIDAVNKKELDENKKLTDEDVVLVLSKLEKQRGESIEAFKKGNRPDLAEKEESELETIREFMPAPLTEKELEELVRGAIASSGASGKNDMGAVMKELKGSYEGRAGGKEVSEEVKRQLAALSSS